MNNYKDLDEKEKEQLMKFPAYISLLAAAATGGLDKQEKKSVIKLTHIKTFSSDPILIDFYKEVEKGFESTITILNEELPHDKASRQNSY